MRALLGNLSDADIRLLRVFMAVVEAGGLSAAELELNIGRSTISRHLKDLEIRLGLTLCRRGRGGFSMTQEGVQIYEYAQRLITSIEDFRHQVNDMHRTLQGQLSVAMFDKTVSNPECRVPDAIAAFTANAPEVLIDIHVVPVNQIEKGILDGRYHVGIIPTHRSSSSLKYIPLFGEQMHLYCGKGHPLFERATSASAQEIKAQRYAGLSFHSPNMETGRKHGLEKSAVANDQEGIATLIRSGVFIGYLPDHYAASFVSAGQMRQIAQSEFNYYCEFAALYRKSPAPTRLVRRFLAALQESHGAAVID
ncbi:Regulatory protein, LysR:LysR, substrate-binding [Marinobacterium lacunae]|uniref:Regulatory protein, LysR:LysR, substrate-binding n=1 Tax=Marinobacterium lacunae TaxID=1232683 RepID=A0A081FYR0_9GAMM|nr:LysR family transcriptional regulator [Marinobacterium lacunae]KEA63665.1 Regulatory protein, LysR:LysR, substrate-binding [Marinobacterium lacunae]MBR9883829.1 LysR family transcriptional regulator [Oceanospirillales bacterium]